VGSHFWRETGPLNRQISIVNVSSNGRTPRIGSSNTISWHGGRPPDLTTSLTLRLDSRPQIRTANFGRRGAGFDEIITPPTNATVISTTALEVLRLLKALNGAERLAGLELFKGERKTKDFRPANGPSVDAVNSWSTHVLHRRGFSLACWSRALTVP
jgi:hypothetical protein